ncbi:MAG: pyridoxal phosphate-dependent aminotransferase [Planctomycetes bacterium]|nr:pyridoxal phosphate-dependent aminotransferase [Planctomycetota bacterium]
MKQAMESASWIRQMFEEGNRLRREVGPENVFDFTLGNPSVPPPPEFQRALEETARNSTPADHRYMTNAGREDTRRAIAERLRSCHGEALQGQHVVMSCGAAGGLNVLMKSVLDRDDEVMLLKPFFPEYLFYVANHGGKVVTVATDADFQPDLDAIAAALNERTRIVLINTPNNPSGAVYDCARVAALGKLIEAHAEKLGRPVYLVMDEPYRRIRYCDEPHPSVIRLCRYGIVVTSFSKELGLAGERIGYVVVNPEMPGSDSLLAALSVATRILGFVNAPAFMQRVLGLCGDASVDIGEYRRHRDLLYGALTGQGYRMPEPRGAFFMFPEAPGGDDLAFCRLLREYNVLVVPGRGFGSPGHVRISYAVPTRTIERAIPLFAEAFARARTE